MLEARTWLDFRRILGTTSLCLIAAAAFGCGNGGGGGDGDRPAAPAASGGDRPTPTPAPTPAPTPTPTASAGIDGKGLYATYCATCHGPSGKGDGPAAMPGSSKPRDFTIGEFKFDTDGNGVAGEDADLLNVARDGAAKFGGVPLMSPWGAVLKDDQLRAIIAYIRSLRQG